MFLQHTLGWYWKGAYQGGCGLGRLWVYPGGELLYPAQDCLPLQPVGGEVRARRKRREGGQTLINTRWPSNHCNITLSCSQAFPSPISPHKMTITLPHTRGLSNHCNINFFTLSCSHHQPCSQTFPTLCTLNMSLRLVSMASSMVLSFLGSVEVVVKEGDWEVLSEKASTRPPHRDPSHDLGHTMNYVST